MKDGEIPVSQETTCTSPKTQQRRSNSSQVAAVNATAKDKCEAVRNRLVLQNKKANTTQDENKFFDPGGEQDWYALPSRPLPLSGRAVLLWFAVLGIFSCGAYHTCSDIHRIDTCYKWLSLKFVANLCHPDAVVLISKS